MLTERPDLLDEAIVELAAPLAFEERADGRAPREEFGGVAPARVLAGGKCHTLRRPDSRGCVRSGRARRRARPYCFIRVFCHVQRRRDLPNFFLSQTPPPQPATAQP